MTGVRAIAPPLGGLALAVVLFFHTRGLDQVAQAGQLGPGFWPRMVLLGLGVSCLAKLVVDVRRGHGTARHVIDAPPPLSAARLAAAAGLLVLYALALPLLGFALATAGFVVAFMVLAGARSAIGIAATAVLTTVAVLYVFVRIVYLPLPKGAGAVEDVTIALYRLLGIF